MQLESTRKKRLHRIENTLKLATKDNLFMAEKRRRKAGRLSLILVLKRRCKLVFFQRIKPSFPAP